MLEACQTVPGWLAKLTTRIMLLDRNLLQSLNIFYHLFIFLEYFWKMGPHVHKHVYMHLTFHISVFLQ